MLSIIVIIMFILSTVFLNKIHNNFISLNIIDLYIFLEKSEKSLL